MFNASQPSAAASSRPNATGPTAEQPHWFASDQDIDLLLRQSEAGSLDRRTLWNWDLNAIKKEAIRPAKDTLDEEDFDFESALDTDEVLNLPNFSRAAMYLALGFRLVASRMDSTHTELNKVLKPLTSATQASESGKKKKIDASHNFIETEPSKLRFSEHEFDTIPEIDPLFQKTLQSFDVGNVKSLLLGTLNISQSGRLVFDSRSSAESTLQICPSPESLFQEHTSEKAQRKWESSRRQRALEASITDAYMAELFDDDPERLRDSLKCIQKVLPPSIPQALGENGVSTALPTINLRKVGLLPGLREISSMKQKLPALILQKHGKLPKRPIVDNEHDDEYDDGYDDGHNDQHEGENNDEHNEHDERDERDERDKRDEHDEHDDHRLDLKKDSEATLQDRFGSSFISDSLVPSSPLPPSSLTSFPPELSLSASQILTGVESITGSISTAILAAIHAAPKPGPTIDRSEGYQNNVGGAESSVSESQEIGVDMETNDNNNDNDNDNDDGGMYENDNQYEYNSEHKVKAEEGEKIDEHTQQQRPVSYDDIGERITKDIGLISTQQIQQIQQGHASGIEKVPPFPSSHAKDHNNINTNEDAEEDVFDDIIPRFTSTSTIDFPSYLSSMSSLTDSMQHTVQSFKHIRSQNKRNASLALPSSTTPSLLTTESELDKMMRIIDSSLGEEGTDAMDGERTVVRLAAISSSSRGNGLSATSPLGDPEERSDGGSKTSKKRGRKAIGMMSTTTSMGTSVDKDKEKEEKTSFIDFSRLLLSGAMEGDSLAGEENEFFDDTEDDNSTQSLHGRQLSKAAVSKLTLAKSKSKSKSTRPTKSTKSMVNGSSVVKNKNGPKSVRDTLPSSIAPLSLISPPSAVVLSDARDYANARTCANLRAEQVNVNPQRLYALATRPFLCLADVEVAGDHVRCIPTPSNLLLRGYRLLISFFPIAGIRREEGFSQYPNRLIKEDNRITTSNSNAQTNAASSEFMVSNQLRGRQTLASGSKSMETGDIPEEGLDSAVQETGLREEQPEYDLDFGLAGDDEDHGGALNGSFTDTLAQQGSILGSIQIPAMNTTMNERKNTMVDLYGDENTMGEEERNTIHNTHDVGDVHNETIHGNTLNQSARGDSDNLNSLRLVAAPPVIVIDDGLSFSNIPKKFNAREMKESIMNVLYFDDVEKVEKTKIKTEPNTTASLPPRSQVSRPNLSRTVLGGIKSRKVLLYSTSDSQQLSTSIVPVATSKLAKERSYETQFNSSSSVSVVPLEVLQKQIKKEVLEEAEPLPAMLGGHTDIVANVIDFSSLLVSLRENENRAEKKKARNKQKKQMDMDTTRVADYFYGLLLLANEQTLELRTHKVEPDFISGHNISKADLGFDLSNFDILSPLDVNRYKQNGNGHGDDGDGNGHSDDDSDEEDKDVRASLENKLTAVKKRRV